MKIIRKKVRSNFNNQAGFGLIELIVAMGLFMIVVVTGTGGVLQTYSLNTLSRTETQAKLYAQEGIAATHSIVKQDWANISAGTYGLDTGGGLWAFSGISDTLGDYTRTTQIEAVERDGSGNIVVSGGTVDPDTFKITSTVNWSLSPTRNNTVDLIAYLTNYRKAIITAGDWSTPSQQSSFNISGSNNGWKVRVDGNYAYIARNYGSPDFVVMDISDLNAPTIVGSMNLSGYAYEIFKAGNYVYAGSPNNASEFQVIDVSVPTAPILGGSYNLSGSQNGQGTYVVGNTAYVTRRSSSSELSILDISTPTSPTLLGSINLSGDANDVVVVGNYAYIASNSNELQVVDISNSAAPSFVGDLNLSGGSNGETIDAEGSILILGRASGDVNIIDISTPTSPVNLAMYDATSFVRDVDYVASLGYVFIASDANSSEFSIIDVSTPSAPTLVTAINLSNDLNGIYYDETLDRVFAVGDSNTEEFLIIQPN